MWASADPILDEYLDGKPNGGVFNPSNLGLYTYVGNNPLIMNDPDGKAKKAPWILLGVEIDPNAQYGSVMRVYRGRKYYGTYIYNSRKDNGGGIKGGVYPFRVGTHPISGGASKHFYTDHGKAYMAINLYKDKVGGSRKIPALPYLANGQKSNRKYYWYVNMHAGNYLRLDKFGHMYPLSKAHTGSLACQVFPISIGRPPKGYSASDPKTWPYFNSFMSHFKEGDTGIYILRRTGGGTQPAK